MKTNIKTKIKNLSLATNLRFIIFSLALVSILSYLIVVNHTNTMGIEIGEMQVKISELKDQSRDLENQATQLQAMQRIESISSLELSMVQAETYDYILPNEEAVAVRQ
ncbi:MAG TPA: hypothetical protein VJK25_01800 [Patescibacteria group bacterium]|nr:hypothetical protein [Patescibacteria group bacterium]